MRIRTTTADDNKFVLSQKLRLCTASRDSALDDKRAAQRNSPSALLSELLEGSDFAFRGADAVYDEQMGMKKREGMKKERTRKRGSE